MISGPGAIPARPTARLVALILLVAAAAMPLGACKKTPPRETGRLDGLSQSYLDNYAAIATTLAQVTDEDSAKEGAARIKALQAEMKVIGDKMGKLSAEYQKRFSRRFGAAFTEIRTKMAAERKRIASMPEVDAVFSEAMQAESTG